MRNSPYSDADIGNLKTIWMADNIDLNPAVLLIPQDIPLYKIGAFSEWYAVTFRYWGASTNPTSVQFGIHTAADGLGTAIVTGGATLGAMASPTVTAQGTISSTALSTSNTLFFRLTTRQGSACTLQGLSIIGIPTKR
jgi:hypothetical protein